MSVIGQSDGGAVGTVVLWIVVLVVVAVVFGVVLMKIRKALLSEDDGGSGPALPLAELRGLRDRGELSEEEYRRAVGVISDRAKAGGGGSASGIGSAPDAGGGSG